MAKNLIRSLVIGFGFLNGVWLAIGINPQDELIKFLQPLLIGLHPIMKTLFIVLPTIILIGTIITLLSIYKKGGVLGSLAVIMGFVAGALVLINYVLSAGLLLIALILGYFSLRNIRR